MDKTLREGDIEAIAQRVVQIMATRLGSPDLKSENRPAANAPAPSAQRLAYTIDELMAELGVSRTTIWRWEAIGVLHPVPHLRHKIFSRDAVEKFLKGQASTAPTTNYRGRRRGAAQDRPKSQAPASP